MFTRIHASPDVLVVHDPLLPCLVHARLTLHVAEFQVCLQTSAPHRKFLSSVILSLQLLELSFGERWLPISLSLDSYLIYSSLPSLKNLYLFILTYYQFFNAHCLYQSPAFDVQKIQALALQCSPMFCFKAIIYIRGFNVYSDTQRLSTEFFPSEFCNKGLCVASHS